jgi:hypothetical protein
MRNNNTIVILVLLNPGNFELFFALTLICLISIFTSK